MTEEKKEKKDLSEIIDFIGGVVVLMAITALTVSAIVFIWAETSEMETICFKVGGTALVVLFAVIIIGMMYMDYDNDGGNLPM